MVTSVNSCQLSAVSHQLSAVSQDNLQDGPV